MQGWTAPLLTALGAALLALPAEAGSVCAQAADRFEACLGELAGMPAPVRDLEACERDPATVALYTRCMPRLDCQAWLDCLRSEVMTAVEAERREQGRALAGLSRAEACAASVAGGLRSIALQVVVAHGERPEEAVGEGRTCVIEAEDPQSCLLPAERELLGRYAEQRQRDCEAWPEPLAACVLGLPDATGCDPDDHPFWRLPLDHGAEGPKVAWEAEVGAPHFDAGLLWAGDRLIATAEGGLVSAHRGGQHLWTLEQTLREPLWVDGLVVGRDRRGGLVVVDADRGEVRATLLPGVQAHAARGNRVLAVTEDGLLHTFRPLRCRGESGRCAGRGVHLDDAWPNRVAVVGDHLVVDTLDELVAFKGGRRVWSLQLEDDLLALGALGDQHLTVIERHAVLLDVEGCRVADGATWSALPEACRLARSEDPLDYAAPVAAGPDAVAFNDHGFIARTQLLGPGRAWSANTGGIGQVASDGRLVYTLADAGAGGPLVLVALDVRTGEGVWHTVLAEELPDHLWASGFAVVYGPAGIAARAGDRVWVVRP